MMPTFNILVVHTSSRVYASASKNYLPTLPYPAYTERGRRTTDMPFVYSANVLQAAELTHNAQHDT